MRKHIKCKYDDAEITIVLEDKEIYYLHPLTNQKCESLQQVYQGWIDRDKKDQENQEKLKHEIKRNLDLIEEWLDDNRREVDFLKDDFMTWEVKQNDKIY